MPSLLTAAADAACACPACGETLRTNLAHAGRRARCRHCRHEFKIPTRQELIDFAAAVLIAEDVEAEFAERQNEQGPPRPGSA